jgi:hypothetical protein
LGIRVQTWLGGEDGLCSHFLSGPLDEFQAWAHSVDAEFPGEVHEDVLPLIAEVRARGAPALVATSKDSARRVDWMLDLYYGDFCDSGEWHWLMRPADASALSQRYFAEAANWIESAQPNSKCAPLWPLLLSGRAVLRDASLLPYESDDGVYRLSYWTLQECRTLRNEFETFLGMMPSGDGEVAVAAALRAVSEATRANVGLILTVA